MSDRRSAVHSPRTADPDAPVVVRFAALGDVVLLTPLLQALAERHGRPVHLLSSGAWTPQLLTHDPAVGELRLVTSRRAPYWLTPTQWWARRWLEAHRGAVYLCDPDPFAARLVARAGVPDGRVVRAWDHRPAQPIHWVDWWLHIAALDPPPSFGLALHVGRVSYGNVGGGNRLDFTCIGPAINLAARLEKLAAEQQRTIVASSAFAAHVPEAFAPLGEFDLKGFDARQTVHALSS